LPKDAKKDSNYHLFTAETSFFAELSSTSTKQDATQCLGKHQSGVAQLWHADLLNVDGV